jgi:oxaloacetate decarboxylase alpha subunit
MNSNENETDASAEAEAARKRLHRIPLRITDTTLRDAHQSLWATRMRTKDILGIVDTVDSAGFYSLEVWGGATFDTCLRFLRENPWERLRQIKAKCTKTPLQMLLRGQNVVGYRNYPDDLLDRFVALACQNGIDIFRVFDALNDTRNVEQAIKSVKKYGGHAQGTICYTISPMHTVKEFCRIAHELTAIGVDSICIKDMAGILSPISCRKLVSALIREVKVPIQIHSHATSGMATATYVEGVVAGAGAIDCAISPMAGFSSQPPVETMLAIFEETYYHANLDVTALRKMCDYFIKLAPERRLSHHPDNVIDPEILIHHIPGGMISNLRSQLQQQNALDRLDEVLTELPLVRADLGYPPLVTPTSQIVGVQSVLNVLSGERYKMVTQETKDYVRGMYGRSPAPIAPRIRKKILGEEKLITCRPADLLAPMLPQATTNVDPSLIKNEEDILSYCLFPEVALDYFRWRNTPIEERATPPADIELMKEKKAKVQTTAPAEASAAPQAFLATEDYREIQQLLDKVHQLQFSEIVIRRNDLTLSLKSEGMAVQQDSGGSTAKAATQPAAKSATATAKPPTPKPAPLPEKAANSAPTIRAPLNGTLYLSEGPGKPILAKAGDTVKAGDPVCVVEAMKLFNQIKAPCNCKIVQCLVEHGQAVTKDQALFTYEPA